MCLLLSVSASAVSAALFESALFHLRSAFSARLSAPLDGPLRGAEHAEAAQQCLLRASHLDGSNAAVQCLLMLRAAEDGKLAEAQQWAQSAAEHFEASQPDESPQWLTVRPLCPHQPAMPFITC